MKDQKVKGIRQRKIKKMTIKSMEEMKAIMVILVIQDQETKNLVTEIRQKVTDHIHKMKNRRKS